MKLDKLLKRLKRDAMASPQKAGALGLMVLVALYFWSPLVLKSMKGKGKPGAKVASTIILGDDPVLVKAVVHPASNAVHWDKVRKVVAQDRLMSAAKYHANWQNPFQRLAIVEQAASTTEPTANKTEAKPVLPATPKLEPAAARQQLAGVLLSSVLMSPRDRAAVIQGIVYRVGDVLSLGGENGAPALELRVASIDEQGVDLVHEQQRFRLEQVKPKLSPGDYLRRD